MNTKKAVELVGIAVEKELGRLAVQANLYRDYKLESAKNWHLKREMLREAWETIQAALDTNLPEA